MRRFSTPLFLAATLTLFPVLAHAEDLAQSDKDFLTQAAQGDISEVKLGELAITKASTPAIKNFAERMIKDHTKSDDQLKALAAKKGLNLPTDMDSEHQKTYDDLSKLSGAQFDKAYMDVMMKDHQTEISAFQTQLKTTKDKDIKKFTNDSLPTLKKHEKLATSTENHVKHM